MTTVTGRESRDARGTTLDRVSRDESLTVMRDGKLVAALTPVGHASPPPSVLVARRQALPRVDLVAWRMDLDATVDTRL
ncbi:MAG: hypothetical protein LBK59_04190 [Bifidobacteriaceae bacterium]|nr:hypothetical protein [Bifidobacteriaceae bacterium]